MHPRSELEWLPLSLHVTWLHARLPCYLPATILTTWKKKTEKTKKNLEISSDLQRVTSYRKHAVPNTYLFGAWKCIATYYRWDWWYYSADRKSMSLVNREKKVNTEHYLLGLGRGGEAYVLTLDSKKTLTVVNRVQITQSCQVFI